jgi:magnesium transporter
MANWLMTYQVLSHERVTWTDITKATTADMERLKEAYPHFHPLDLEDCLSHLERPKIDEYDEYLFIVMQFPLWDASSRVSRPAEVDIFIGAGYLVTVHNSELKPLIDFFQQVEAYANMRERYMASGASRLLHAVIDRLVDNVFPLLYKVDANIRTIEDEIFTEDMRKIIQNLSIIRRDIISLRRIIRPQLAILANLEEVDRPFIREDLDVYFGDIHDHLTKARDIVEDDAEVIAGLADATDTLASYRINEVMRILTVISVVMLPLTLISGIYGMNIPLPFERNPNSFLGIMGLMLVISISMLLYFRHRRWL